MNIFTYFINLIKNKSLSSQSVLIMRTPHQECNWAGVPVLPFWTQDPLCSSQLLMDGSQPMTETTACSWERQDASEVDIGHWLTLVTFFPSLHHAGSDLPSLTFTEFSIFFCIWVLLIKPLSYYSWGSQGKNTYWSGLPIPLPGDLPNPGSNSDLLKCRQILYHLSHQISSDCRGLWKFICNISIMSMMNSHPLSFLRIII